MDLEVAIKKIKEIRNENLDEINRVEDYVNTGEEEETVEAINIILNELDKKDKVIDLMTEKTANEKINRKERWCKCIKENVECKDEWICKECLKEYFYKKVEEK